MKSGKMKILDTQLINNESSVLIRGEHDTQRPSVEMSVDRRSSKARANDRIQRPSFISNPKLMDSLSSLNGDAQKTVIRLITVITIIFFFMCFAMIAFTLRISEKVDAQSKIILIGQNFGKILQN